jgi:glutaredoxin
MNLKLYTIPGCDECEEVRKFIGEAPVKIVELIKNEEKWCEEVEDGLVPVSYRGFPVLYFGESNGNSYALAGKEGIESFLKKGFVHDDKMCPYSQETCTEKKCELFSVLYNGLIPEGACSIKWLPLLTTEMISKK